MEAHKKKIAAMTAVLYYLQAEQEAYEYGGALLRDRPAFQQTRAGVWSHSGRQAEMMYRSMLQMRQLPGWNR